MDAKDDLVAGMAALPGDPAGDVQKLTIQMAQLVEVVKSTRNAVDVQVREGRDPTRARWVERQRQPSPSSPRAPGG